MTAELNGKIAVVTGAGSGIGQGIARLFCAEGAWVLGVDRDANGLAETRAQCPAARFAELVGDVTDATLPDAIRKALPGPLDILINNAGVGAGGMIEATTDDDLRRFLEINVVGLFRIARMGVDLMKARGGSIVNLASIFAEVGATSSAAYSTSKGAVAALTRQMATDYGPIGIRVNALGPGLIETPLTRERIRDQAWRRTIFIDQAPLRRVGQPEDVANAALFLASDRSAFITGELLRVDGGWAMGRYPRETAG